jgi:hypothetical protein
MQKSFLFLCFLFIHASTIYAQQKLRGKIVSNTRESVQRAVIRNINSGSIAVSDAQGYFEIMVTSTDTLKITHVNFEQKIHVVNNESKVQIELIARNRELNEVAVTSERFKSVLDRENENILDFVFHQGKLVTLVKEQKKYKIKLFHEQQERVYDLPFEKPEGFYQDFYENLYVVAKDSAYLVSLGMFLGVIAAYDLDKLDREVKPIAFDSKYTLITEQLTVMNKRYELVKIVKPEFNKEIIYESIDDIGAEGAAGQYQKIICSYYSCTSPTENVIENNAWDGNLLSLAVTNDLLEEISWFLTTDAKEVNIQSKTYHNSLVVFDFNELQVLQVNVFGEKAYDVRLTGIPEKEREKLLVLKDQTKNEFYVYNPNEAVVQIGKINLESGETNQVLRLSEVTFPEKLVVEDGWLYVLESNKNGFKKLYRLKLS